MNTTKEGEVVGKRASRQRLKSASTTIQQGRFVGFLRKEEELFPSKRKERKVFLFRWKLQPVSHVTYTQETRR
jgi:hypothetical protein